MDRNALEVAKLHVEKHSTSSASILRMVILGGQDGLVNVLGVILAVAIATSDSRIVIIAGTAAAFAESISMAAVGYTSAKATKDHYFAERRREEFEVKEMPEVEREEIRLIYFKKGLRGKQLDSIVKTITSNEKLWVDTMMREELGLSESEFVNPAREAAVIGVSSLAGSFIPLLPFFFLPVAIATYLGAVLSVVVLFALGAYKAVITSGSWWKNGLEIAGVGIGAAIAGYLIGSALGIAIT